jgi:hypothetical protein
MWIYRGVVAASPFRVDVPSSSQSIRFCSKVAWMEMDDEVELRKIFRPLDLSLHE